jgi:3-ketosteroid 9alpha-monooxygenase subunit A
MEGWPHTTHPTGWYMVGWTWTVQPGELKPLTLFGSEVVLYRTEQGQANVVDAFCPHLGAHIGYGGSVRGEALQCPWHGWQYDVHGRNVHIPFTDRVNNAVRVKRWHLRELDHLIIVWYDALGRDPWWEWPGIPEFRDAGEYYQPYEYPNAAVCYGILKVVPQLPLENTADPMHFPFVHGSAEPAVHEIFETQDHYLRIRFKVLFGGGRAQTWMTPNGPEYGIIDGENWALGLGVARFEIGGLRAAQVVATTPVDEAHSMVFTTMASTREPGQEGGPAGRSARMMDEQMEQVRQDFFIWEHQRYVQRPSFLMPQERNFAALRRWFEQFYPDESRPESVSFAEGS